ncbi:g5608 [Coccomyxa elongata]
MAETVSKGVNASDLSIQPTELKFRFELRKNIPVTLSLHNPGQEKVAFKVKTTSPKKYCVRPSSGVVEPGATKDVQVIMQAQREYPPTLADCKDKFLVQTVKVSPKVTEITPDIFDGANASNIKQSKLRVVLVGPPKPPSPVPEAAGRGEASWRRAAEVVDQRTVYFGASAHCGAACFLLGTLSLSLVLSGLSGPGDMVAHMVSYWLVHVPRNFL